MSYGVGFLKWIKDTHRIQGCTCHYQFPPAHGHIRAWIFCWGSQEHNEAMNLILWLLIGSLKWLISLLAKKLVMPQWWKNCFFFRNCDIAWCTQNHYLLSK